MQAFIWTFSILVLLVDKTIYEFKMINVKLLENNEEW